MTGQDEQSPFVVPGCEENPGQPLCPWTEECVHHDSYYSEVGGMGRAYQKFLTRFDKPDKLCNRGCLLVVTGPPRSGKTSLINRCVHRVDIGLKRVDKKAFIVDLTNVCSEGMTVDDRMRLVSTRLVTTLQPLKLEDWITREIVNEREKIDSTFPMLEHVHVGPFDGKRMFIILLPSLEPDKADDEIGRYLRVLRPGTLLMVEASAEAVRHADHDWSPLRLELSYLGEGEAYRLVEGWPPATSGSGHRTVRKAEMDKLEQFVANSGVNIASGQLLATLRTVCKPSRIDGTTRSSALDYVEYYEILEAMLGPLMIGASGQGIRRP